MYLSHNNSGDLKIERHKGKITTLGWVCFKEYSYVPYKELSQRNWMRRICNILTIAGADTASVLEAVENMKFRDFEDNMQECCVVSAGVNYIVMVNAKDYEHSRVKAVTPDELVQIVNEQNPPA